MMHILENFLKKLKITIEKDEILEYNCRMAVLAGSFCVNKQCVLLE